LIFRLKRKPLWPFGFMKVVFMGTPQAAVPTLERLLADGHEVVAVYSQPDRPSGRGNKITFSPVKQFALDHGLHILQPTKIKTAEALEEFKSLNGDVAVVVAYGRILPEGFLNAFPSGAINVHFSLLPNYRGAAPVNWAIVNGETETGVTTMKMDVGLDTGDILLQRTESISPDETAPELMERLGFVGAELLSETLRDLSSIEPQPQDHSRATLAPIMKREDGLIDWNMTAAEIANRVRGFQPFPSSFTLRNGQKLTFWNSLPADAVFNAAGSGVVVNVDRSEFIVGCGGGTALVVREVQPEGKRRMSATDYVNGSHLSPGEVLGS
jgi:methionyl-tRNA formyltransferase